MKDLEIRLKKNKYFMFLVFFVYDNLRDVNCLRDIWIDVGIIYLKDLDFVFKVMF